MNHQIIQLLTTIGIISGIFILLVIIIKVFIPDEPFNPRSDWKDF